MKKFLNSFYVLLLAGVSLLVASCAGPNKLRNANSNIGQYDITVIDNCQYIVLRQGEAGTSITHKGDYTNPIHPRR
ncbi:hypothetical protein [Telluribacter sp.]|uniref:hypothetical protein n=1 Tax=Telluribacter sp. TaxID=1978767 RepID=UPI002E12B24C|nr:hypothetical protein [Telluribacter sp.]